MSEKGWVPFNGKSTTVSRVIEALVVAAIVGGITVYGSSKVMDVRMDQLCGSVEKLSKVAETLSTITAALQIKDATQEIRIEALEKKHSWDSHPKRESKP